MNISQPLTTLTSARWITLANSITESFRLTETEGKRLFESKTARLIAALPYLAGCEQPDRTALGHLAVYLLAQRGPGRWTFDHAPEDNQDVLHRLACISAFQGGDSAILARGMRLLAVQMICGYARDMAKDTVTGEYNPLVEGVWDGQKLVDGLISDIETVHCPAMDDIMSVHEAQSQWWA